MSNTKYLLKEIKTAIEDNRLSLIIGAGFSKNISNEHFPDWNQLLTDMVKEMYSDEIDPLVDEKKEIIRIINRVGYLEVASEYIRRKGYREAIDVYIEERTPYLNLNDGKISLCIGDKEVVSNLGSELDIHRKLIKLGVRSIYTFNYDNTLEFIAGTDKTSEFLTKESELGVRLQHLYKEYGGYDRLIKELKLEQPISVELNNETTIGSQVEPQSALFAKIDNYIAESEVLKSYGFVPIENAFNARSVIDNNEQSYESSKSKLEAEKANIKSRREALYHLITCSREISLTERVNGIFKLHGNLRIPKGDKAYGFDNDIRKQYVICKEDYDTYPNKHDAFVSLMKIALLKGSFCLLGFSGDDPNFLMWMSWVREVNRGDQKLSGKIFFIDVEDSISKEKRLLLMNHNIEHVYLKDIYGDKDRSSLISLFLDAISPDSTFFENYKEAWSKISITTDHTKPPTINLEGVDMLWKSLKYCRYPKLDSCEHNSRNMLLWNMYSLIKHNLIDERSAKAIYASFTGELLPLSAIIDYTKKGDDAEINVFMNQISPLKDIAPLFEVLDIRVNILHGKLYKIKDSEKGSEKIYEVVLSHLFNLDFCGAINILNKWQTEGERHWTPKRLGLLSVFRNIEQSDWETKMLPDYYSCLQDYIYGVDTIVRLRGMIFERSNGGISFDEDIKETRYNILKENPHLNRLWDNFEYLKKELNEKKIKVNPLGGSTTTRTLNQWDYPLKYSIQLLQAFLETGIPMQTNGSSYIEKSDWLLVFKNIFSIYPFPCLYFSLQFGSDTKFVKRIAQEYVFSPNISNQLLADMLLKMLGACRKEQTPYNIKQGIFVMAPIFMNRVSYDKWGDYFEKFYADFDFSDTDINRTRNDSAYDFILAGVKLSTNADFKSKVLNDILSKPQGIDDFYNNLLISAINGVHDIMQSEDMKLAIDNLISTAKIPAQYFVLMNMYEVLDKEQQDKLISSLTNFDYSNEVDPTLIQASSRFSEGNKALQSKIKIEISNSRLLWKNGIIENPEGGRTIKYSAFSPLDINLFQEYIIFDKNELVGIYRKLKASFSGIKKDIDFKNSNNDFKNTFFDNSWRKLLIQMKEFLRTNKKALSSQDDYKTIVKEVETYYEKESGITNILEALASGDGRKIGNAIERLVYDCEMYGINKFMQEYQTIAQMIILKTDLRLKSCIIHFSWSISENHTKFDKSIFMPLVKIILEQYSCYFKSRNAENWEFDAEKDLIEKYLIILYGAYKKWGGKLTFWDKYTPIFISNR